MNSESCFIANDYCGWNYNTCRYTHIPSGDTLLSNKYNSQDKRIKACIDWFKKYPDVKIYDCPGAYNTDGRFVGTTDDLIKKGEAQL